jgi:hypothetical protein
MLVLCSISALSRSYDKYVKYIFSALSVTTGKVNGASWNLLDEPTGAGGTNHAHWLRLSRTTYNQAHSFTALFDHAFLNEKQTSAHRVASCSLEEEDVAPVYHKVLKQRTAGPHRPLVTWRKERDVVRSAENKKQKFIY